MCAVCIVFVFVFRWRTLKSTEIEPIRNNEKVCFLTVSNDDDDYKHYRYSCEFCFVYYEKLILNRTLSNIIHIFFVVVVPIQFGMAIIHEKKRERGVHFFLFSEEWTKTKFHKKILFPRIWWDRLLFVCLGFWDPK